MVFSALALAELFHNAGYSVATFDSAFNWHFIVSSNPYPRLPGFLPEDAAAVKMLIAAALGSSAAMACTSFTIHRTRSETGRMLVQKCRDSTMRKLDAAMMKSPGGRRWMRIGANGGAMFAMNDRGVAVTVNTGNQLQGDDIPAKAGLILFALKNGIPVISSMGTARRTDPSKITVTALGKTSACPLARKLRKLLRDEPASKAVPVVMSKETPCEVEMGNPLPSSGMVPAAVGINMAAFVINTFCKEL